MPGSFKTESVVLRSIRFGEADRVLHLYTPGRGRLGAVAKGVRRTRSRFGGRLEPFSRVSLVLHEGRGELCTVTAAETVDAYPRLRERAASIEAAAGACGAVLRLLDSVDPNPPAYNLLCRYLGMLDDPADPSAPDLGTRLAFRFKLALAAGFAPELGACARCGAVEHLSGFSGAAGGVVCEGCEGEAFPLTSEAHDFMVAALGKPLSEVPSATEASLRQAERAVSETLEHHAHVRLRPAA